MLLPQVGGSKHSQSPVMPSTRSGDGASMRRRDLKRELIHAPAGGDRTGTATASGWPRTPDGGGGDDKGRGASVPRPKRANGTKVIVPSYA
jgi:hypothetical protein